MTKKQIKEIESKRDKYINTVGGMFKTKDMNRGIELIFQIVECELLLEAECNK